MSISYFYNFSARTFPNYSREVFNSMIVSDGYILNAGFDINNPSEDITAINLNNSIIIPPFVDSHTHFMQTGIVNSGCQLDEAYALDEVFDIVSKEAKKSNIILGWNFDKSEIYEKRFPTLKELDKISSSKFIWLVSKDLHECVANSEAIKWAKKEFPDLKTENGLISGEAYNYLCYKINDLLSEDYKLNGLKKAEEICISKGVATVHCLEGTEKNPYEALLVDKFFKNSPLEAHIYNQSSNPAVPLKNNWKQMGGCILVDGSIGSRTAAMTENYYDYPTKGNMFLNSDQILNLTKVACKNNLQLALHAIGDLACEIVATNYKWAYETFGEQERPHRIEHFIIPNFKAMRNAKIANAIIGIQPAYDYFWGGENGLYAQRLGVERASYCNPYRTLIDSGLVLIGGSDSPVTPIDPLLGIHSLVNHSNPEEQISINQALATFINEPHRATGNYERRGHLRIGEKADFILINRDPFLIAKENLKYIKVEAMYIDGKKV